jgi:hypothetical protein
MRLTIANPRNFLPEYIIRGDLTLCRNDLGDGGWSIHLGDHSRVLASGCAEWDETKQRWRRPTEADYAGALVVTRASSTRCNTPCRICDIGRLGMGAA